MEPLYILTVVICLHAGQCAPPWESKNPMEKDVCIALKDVQIAVFDELTKGMQEPPTLKVDCVPVGDEA